MLQSQRVSRSGLVFGSSLLTTADPNGVDMNRHREVPSDVWYDMERFQMDHIAEVLAKLSENRLDDEIWGKVMVMERARRVAKAYLRKTTLIVDGSDEEFDGRTLGFNHFPNSMRDDHTLEIKSKIGDGVIIKMDYQGNIKAMARGSTPIFIQGWKDTKNTCMSQRLVRLQGRLKTSMGGNEDEQVLKIFDMRRFKSYVESDSVDFQTDAKHLLMKTCVRVALVKDGGGTDPMKTPCWFMIINLVALDMLVTKMPELTSAGALASLYGGADKVPRFTNQTSILQAGSDIYTNPAALTQIIAAAVQQASNQSSKQPIDVDQLAMLASSISVQQPAHNRKSRRCRTFSDSDDSPESSSDHRSRGRSVCTMSSAASSSGVSGFSSHRREKTRNRASAGKSLDPIYRLQEVEKEDEDKNESKYARGPMRPRLSDDVFICQNPSESKPKHQMQSSTSDYDSNKELDSGSWSSNTRSALSSNSQSNVDIQRSYSPSLPSENEDSRQTLQPSVIQVNNSDDVPRFYAHSLARGISKPRATVTERTTSQTLPQPRRLPQKSVSVSCGTTVSVSRRDSQQQFNPLDYEENAVQIAKTSCAPATTLPERTTSTTTTESRIPQARPFETSPDECRTHIPVSRGPSTNPTPQAYPTTVPSNDPHTTPNKGTFLGRQLRNLWNSWALRGSQPQSTGGKTSWLGGFRRRPKCPLIPEQHYSPQNSNKCSANADRQLPDVPRHVPAAFRALGAQDSRYVPASGLYQSPANLRCGNITQRRPDVCAERPLWAENSSRRGLRRCNDADFAAAAGEYGYNRVAPREIRAGPRHPEEILMY